MNFSTPLNAKQRFLLRNRVATITLSLAFLTQQVFAQEQVATKTEAPIQQQVEVRAETAKYDPRREDTVTKFVITKEEIEKYGDTKIQDFLKRQPGMIGSNLHGLVGYTQYLIDGQRTPPGFSLDDVDPTQVERVEIMRSAVAEFSTQGLAGTINFVMNKKIKSTRRNFGVALSHEQPVSLQKKLTFQHADKFEDFSYDFSGIVFDHFWKATTSSSESRAHFGQSGASQMLNEASAARPSGFQISPVIVWKPSNAAIFTLSSLFAQSHFQISSNATDVNRISDQMQPLVKIIKSNADVTPTRTNMSLKWEQTFENEAKLESAIKIGRFSYGNGDRSRVRIEDARGNILDNRTSDIQSEIKEWNLHGNFTRAIFEKHVLKLGWNVAKKEANRLKEGGDLGSESAVVTTNSIAAFVQDEWKMSEAWSHYFGLRWESFQTSGSGSLFDTFKNKTHVVSPIAQTLWKAPESKEDQFRFALARTFKNPDGSQLYRTTSIEPQNTFHTPDEVGNTHLRPEIALGVDVAYEHFGANELNYSASVYIKHVHDVIRDNLRNRQDRWEHNMVNDGDARTHGVGLEIQGPLSVLFSDIKHLNAKAHLSRNWSRTSTVTGPNNRFAMQAPLAANFSMEYVPNATWSMGFDYGYTKGYEAKISETSTYYYLAQHDLNSFLKWTISKDLKVHFSIDNLFRNDFVNRQRYRGVEQEIDAVLRSPGFRQFKVSTNMSF
jgi:outer membrane receptor for ferrienterochelin and colicins